MCRQGEEGKAVREACSVWSESKIKILGYESEEREKKKYVTGREVPDRKGSVKQGGQ